MALRLRSLSEDSVDSYTHTWTVCLFLVLAFILLVVPHSGNNPKSQDELYEASCWCPARFTGSQVRYTNAICSKAFNAFVRGESPIHEVYIVSVISAVDKTGDVTPTPNTNATNRNDTKVDGDDDSDSISWLVGHRSAALLFIFAIALRLPRVLVSIISGCCDNAINIGVTLEWANRHQAANGKTGRRIDGTLKTAFSNSNIKGSTTYLYIMMKVLMFIVIAIEIAVVASAMSNHDSSTASERDTESSSSFTNEHIYHCGFSFSSYRYTVQCFFEQQQQQQQESNIQPSSMTMPLWVKFTILPNAFSVVLINLIVLLVANVFNTLVWLVKLSSDSTRAHLGIDRDAPLDFVLLILMARDNFGVGLATDLVESYNVDKAVDGNHEAKDCL